MPKITCFIIFACVSLCSCAERKDLLERNLTFYHGTGFQKGGRPAEAGLTAPDPDLIKPIRYRNGPAFTPNRFGIPNTRHQMTLRRPQPRPAPPGQMPGQMPQYAPLSEDGFYQNPYLPAQNYYRKQDDEFYSEPIGPQYGGNPQEQLIDINKIPTRQY